MKKAWLSALLNFFFMGAGYLYNGKKVLVGLLLTLGAIGMTFLEQVYTFSDGMPLQEHDQTAFMILFGCVFIINTGLAIDSFQEAKSINESKKDEA